ncbi:MAG: ATPase subunit of ABC transporter with duplicated ATPase domains [Candidatus Azotimanducaceae bacterium]
MRDERLYEFSLPYSKAKEALQSHDEAAAERLRQEEKTIKQLSESAKRLATWGKVYDNEKLAAKAKTMEKRIEKLEESKTFVSRGPGLSLTLDMQGSRANRALQVEQHNVLSPDNKILFHIEDFYMRPGDRVALLGHNGAGKTSFIHQLTHSFAAGESETIRFNPQCELGYYDQEIERLNSAHSMLESLRANCTKGTETDFKAGLIHAGFPYADMDKKVGVLSGGEMARLMFLIIRLNRPNYLILDEPTNHIDIQGKEELEAQIIESNATVLITSHDRSFVDNIAERYVVIRNGKLVEINDPTTFYLETLPTSPSSDPSPNAPRLEGPTADHSDSSEEVILARLIALEDKLTADLERKPKFQKLRLHAAWKLEIDDLQKQLD